MGLGGPHFADEFVWCEAAEALEAAAKVVGCDEVVQVPLGPIVAALVEAPDGSILGGAVHPLDLTITGHDALGVFVSRYFAVVAYGETGDRPAFGLRPYGGPAEGGEAEPWTPLRAPLNRGASS